MIVLHLGLEGCSQPRELWFVDVLMYMTYNVCVYVVCNVVCNSSKHASEPERVLRCIYIHDTYTWSVKETAIVDGTLASSATQRVSWQYRSLMAVINVCQVVS